MTDPGTPGIFRWVNGRYVFVPARRPTVGETCLLYPIDGRYLAIPLARPEAGDPAILEPVGGRYVAVPFVGGATCPTVVASIGYDYIANSATGVVHWTLCNTSTGYTSAEWAARAWAYVEWKIYLDGALVNASNYAGITPYHCFSDFYTTGGGTYTIVLTVRNACGNEGAAAVSVLVDVGGAGVDWGAVGTDWGYTDVAGCMPWRVEAIGRTSAIVVCRKFTVPPAPHLFRTDDSGATWIDTGTIPGSGGLGGIVGTDLNGGYLVSGNPEGSSTDFAVWRYNPEGATYTKVWEVERSTDSPGTAHRLVRTAGGYFLATHDESYYSTDGITWTMTGPSPWPIASGIIDIAPPICPNGRTIYRARQSTFGGDPGGGVWKTNDYGATWAHIYTPARAGSVIAGWADGGLFTGGQRYSGQINDWYQSRNGGGSWATLSQTVIPNGWGIPKQYAHVYHVEAVASTAGFAFAATSNDVTGVLITRDYGSSWETVAHTGGRSGILDGAVLPNGACLAVYETSGGGGMRVYRSAAP